LRRDGLLRPRCSIRKLRYLSHLGTWVPGTLRLANKGTDQVGIWFRTWCGGCSNRRSEFIQPVERGHFISLCQRGVVEYGIAKIFDGRAHGQHGLSDVHDLGGPVTDNVHAQ
jgi:hypothetical protein